MRCITTLILVAAALAATARAASAQEAGGHNGHGYPGHRGPTGSGSPVPRGFRLVDTLADARGIWETEPILPIMGESRIDAGGGGFSELAVVDGRVYVYHTEPDPDGPTVTMTVHQHSSGNGLRPTRLQYWSHRQPPTDPENVARYRRGAALESLDVVTCFDAATGALLWRTALPGGYSFSHFGPSLTPWCEDGRVYSVGTAGHVRALDAATGEPIWEADLGSYHALIGQYLAIAGETGVRTHLATAHTLNSSPVVADGVVVMNAYDQSRLQLHGEAFKSAANSIVGFDAATGRRLWTIPDTCHRWTDACRWVHGGDQYIIAPGPANVKAIEPRAGRILWTIEQGVGDAPAVSEHHLVLVSRMGGFARDAKGAPRDMKCYRISPQGAGLLWEHAQLNKSRHAAPAISGDHLFFPSRTGIACVELATGKLIPAAPGGLRIGGGNVHLSAIENRALGTSMGLRMATLAGDRVVPDPGVFQPEKTVSFAKYVVPAFVDGYIYWRGNRNVYCYDLVKGRTAPPRGAAPDARWSELRTFARQIIEAEQADSRAAEKLNREIIEAVDGKRWAKCTVLVDALRVADPAALAGLAQAMGERLGSDDTMVAVGAARVLGMIGPGGKAAVGRLTAMLAHRDPWRKTEACRALGRIGAADPRTLELIEGLLAHDDAALRARAAKTLCELGPDAFTAVPLDRLLGVLLNDAYFLSASASHGAGGGNYPLWAAPSHHNHLYHVLKRWGPEGIGPVCAWLAQAWERGDDPRYSRDSLLYNTAAVAELYGRYGKQAEPLLPVIEKLIVPHPEGGMALRSPHGGRFAGVCLDVLVDARERITGEDCDDHKVREIYWSDSTPDVFRSSSAKIQQRWERLRAELGGGQAQDRGRRDGGADPARAESVDQADAGRGGGCLPEPGAAPFGLGLD